MTSGLMTRILREATLSVAAEALVLVSFFVYYAMLAAAFTTEEVGWYALMRRALALVIPIVTLGLSEGLAKYLASNPAVRTRLSLMSISGVLIGTLSVAFLFLAVGWPEGVAQIVFADTVWAGYALPFAVFTVGIGLHSYAYACLRGLLHIRAVNFLHVLNLAVLPIVVLGAVSTASLQEVVVLTGLATGAVGIAFLLYAYVVSVKGPEAVIDEAVPTRAFLRFSVTRLPAGLVGAGLSSAVPIMAQRHVPVEEVGFLSISIALLIGLAGIVVPLGTVLLPRVSALWVTSDRGRVSAHLPMLIGAAFQIFAFMSVQLILFADLVVNFWVGPAYADAVPIVRVVLLGAFGFGFFNTVRTFLDAITDRPVNTINGMISLTAAIGLAALAPDFAGAALRALLYAGAIAVSCSILGALTYRALRSRFPDIASGDLRHLVWGLGLALACGAIAELLRPIASGGLAWWLLVETAMGILFFASLWLVGFEWVRFLSKRLLVRT